VSDLRKHLETARSEYLSQRYPGNLAADLLAPKRRYIGPWTLVATAVTGLAAAVLVWIGVHNEPTSSPTGSNNPVAMVTDQIEQPEATISAALTTQPIYVEVAPPGQLVLPPVSDFIQLTPSNSEEMSVPSIGSMPGLFYASDASSSSPNPTS
jgi:hypothetical protein